MTTLFAVLAQVCGLSHKEAADFLGVRVDTVKSWSAGRSQPPVGVLDELSLLATRIIAVADGVVGGIIAHAPGDPGAGVVELGVASDDHEAQDLGWPCVGAHRAAIGLAAARAMIEGYTVEIVPRGSTVSTAAAIQAHDKD